jgi:hypothetical protein
VARCFSRRSNRCGGGAWAWVLGAGGTANLAAPRCLAWIGGQTQETLLGSLELVVVKDTTRMELSKVFDLINRRSRRRFSRRWRKTGHRLSLVRGSTCDALNFVRRTEKRTDTKRDLPGGGTLRGELSRSARQTFQRTVGLNEIAASR